MISIDRIALHLPPDYRDRGRHIADLVGRELAGYSFDQSRTLDRLSLRPINPPAGATDGVVAAEIARSIYGRLQSE